MILASVMTYELSRRLGKDAAAKLFHEQANSALETSEAPCVPAINVVRKLRRFADVAVLHDAGGTSIGHARSRAFSVALAANDCDIWISVDDDIDASPETLRHLVGSIDPDSPQIVIVPCWLRTAEVVNVTLDPESVLDRVSPSGARLRRALFGGFGMVAVSRAALREIAAAWPDLLFVDDDGATRHGIFCEYIYSGWWAREDYAFFSRVPEHVRIEVLLSGLTDHGGKRLRLDTADQQPQIPLPPPYRKRDTERPPALVV